jgi:hypothetical protein
MPEVRASQALKLAGESQRVGVYDLLGGEDFFELARAA